MSEAKTAALKHVRKVIVQLGISRVATILGVHQATVYRWYNGESFPTYDYMWLLEHYPSSPMAA